MNITKFTAALVCSCFLVGCTSTGPTQQAGTPATAAEAGPAPSQPEAQVTAYARGFFVDPNSLQDVEISDLFSVHSYGNPMRGLVVAPHWVMCLKANARNRMGGYSGLKHYAFVFEGGRVVDANDVGGAYGCLNPNRTYTSFSI